MTPRNPRPRLRAAGAAALAALSLMTLTAGLAPAAHADTDRRSDASRDVHGWAGTPSSSGSALVYRDLGAEPDLHRGDITSLTVRHSSASVTIATGLRADARGRVARPWVWTARILTSRNDNVYELIMGDGESDLYRNGRRVVGCAPRVTLTRTGMVGSVPRTCLGDPYRVRVGVETQTKRGAYDPERPRFNYDDALSSGRTYSPYGPTLGRWIVAD